MFIREDTLYLYLRYLGHIHTRLCVYNLQGEFLDEQKVNGIMRGVDREGTFLMQTSYTKHELYLHTADGKRQTFSISITGKNRIEGMLIDPEGNALWVWVWKWGFTQTKNRKLKRVEKHSLLMFIPI